jgi:hypothetical protein
MSETDPVLLTHVQYIRKSVDRVNDRLDIQNGRISEAEQRIAVLHDRSDEAKKTGAKWGAGTGALLTAIWHWFAR